MTTQTLQSILALIGIAIVAFKLRWQVGFCILDSIKFVGHRNDIWFAVGLVLIAQRFLF